MKILLIQTAFIGDVILATPVMESIYSHYPDCTIDVMVRKGNEGLLANFPGIQKVLIWDKREHKIRNLLSLLVTIRKEKYDEVINLQRFLSTGLLTAFSGARETTGFNKNPVSFLFTRKITHEIGNGLHETERNLQLVAHLQCDTALRPSLHPSSADLQSTQGYKSEAYVCMAPTSVWFTKQLPAEQWILLIQSLQKAMPALRIYLLGGKADTEACEQIRLNSNSTSVENLSGKLSFLQTAALMKDAKMNYVNDSAPMHIASAMNAPVTAFFCSTVPAFGFGPLSDNRSIAESKETLSCRPCGLHGYVACPQKHFKCATTISMWEAAKRTV